MSLWAAALFLGWANSALHVAFSEQPLYARRDGLDRPRARAAWLLLPSLGFAAALLAFHRGSWWAGLGVFLALAGIRQLETRTWTGDTVVRLGKYAPSAACLLGWLIGRFAGEAAAWQAACGVMAGIYTLAGLSKLAETGWEWVRPQNHALLIAERSFGAPRPLRALRLAAARSPAVCRFVGLAGLIAELACAFYVFPEARMAVTVLVLGLHAGIVLLLGYVEPEWWLLMLGLSLGP